MLDEGVARSEALLVVLTAGVLTSPSALVVIFEALRLGTATVLLHVE